MKTMIPLIIVVSIFLAFPQQTLADLNDGLAAYYPFNGNADDESGNGHDGTVIGATLSEDRFGNAESAYGFDGQDDYILIGQQPNFPSWGSNAVSLWFLNDGGGVWTGYGQKLMNKGTFFSDFYSDVYPDGGVQYCTSMPWTCIHYSEHDFRDSEWHHLVMTRSGTSGEMWIDGELVGTSNLMSSSNTGVDITVGYSLHADHWQRRYWSGQIDDIRIYDRILTEPEIQSLFDVSIEVSVDIKPGSCPNSLNRNSRGVLPVSVVSTDSFDATAIDGSTVLLSRADGVGGSVAPHGPHSVFDDTATSFDGEPCDCHDLEGDLIPDLSIKFKIATVVEELQLNDSPGGALVELVVTGSLLDGSPFIGSDCIRLVPPSGLPTPPLDGVSSSWDLGERDNATQHLRRRD